MAAKGYSAGAIYLQVVPVFGDVQRAIAREVKDIDRALGDQMERAGEKAGARAGDAASKEMGKALEKGAADSGDKAAKAYAGRFQSQLKSTIAGAQRELDTLNFNTLSDSAKENVERVRRLTKDLDVEINADMDDKKVLGKLEFIRASIEVLTKGKHELAVDANLRSLMADFDKAIAHIETETKKRREFHFGGEKELRQLERQMGSFERAAKAAMKKAADHIEGSANKAVKKLHADLVALGELEVGIDISSERLRREVDVIMDDLDRISRQDVEVEAKFAAIQAHKDLAAFGKAVDDTIDTRVIKRGMGVFEKTIKTAMAKAAGYIEHSASREVQELHAELVRLGNLRVGIDIGANQLRREANAVMRELERLSMEDVEIDVKLAAGKGYAELAAYDQAIRRVDGRVIKTKAKVETKEAQRNFLGIKRSGDDAANTFRSFNVMILAVAGAGPALVPVLGAIAGGLLALGPAAAVGVAGLGAVLVGFSGLGNAITALQNQQDQQAMTAQTAANANRSAGQAIQDAVRGVADAERNAAQAAEDASRRVADAREQAAEAVENALDRQQDAQESYADSIDSVREAEAALRDARAAAAGTGDDIKDRMADNQLARDQGVLDVFNATAAYDATMADGSATNADKEQARINLEQTRRRLEELREEQAELAKEQEKWRKEGVNGTEEVQSAQENLSDAIDQQRDAYEALQDAAEAVDEARAEGARNVADAIEAQNQTLAENARSVEAARRALVRAREASDDIATSMNAQQQAVDNAMDALGPAGRKFARFLFGMRDGFRAFRNDIQAAMLPSIQEAIEGFIGSKNAGTARGMLVILADSFGRFVKALSVSFQGPAWGAFFEMLAKYGPPIMDAYGGAFISFMEAMASIMVTLAPYALRLAEGFEGLMAAFAEWAASEAGAATLSGFMDRMAEVAPEVLRAVAMLAVALANLFVAIAPYSEMILALLTGFLEFVAGLDPDILGAFVATLLVGITASQLAYGTMMLLLAGGALLAHTITLLVFALVAVGLAIYAVYRQNETLGTILGVIAVSVLAVVAAMKVWKFTMAVMRGVQLGMAAATYGAVGATYAQTTAAKVAMAITKAWIIVQKAFNAVMRRNPIAMLIIAIIALVAAVIYLWKNHEWFRDIVTAVWEKIKAAFWSAWEVAKVVFAAIGDAAMWLWEKAIKPAFNFIWGAIKAAFKGIKWVWDNILWPVIKAIGKFIWNLWKAYFKVVTVLIAAAWKALMIGLKWAWDNILKPVFDGIAWGAKWLWEKALKPAFDWIGKRWDELMLGMEVIWKAVLKPLFNYIAEKTLPKLKGAFETTVEAISEIWEGLKAVVGKPIKFVIEKVINEGLIGGFNKIADWVDMDGFDPIKVPDWMQSYATGGIMPGYTPGRDVHTFVSPTGGRLNLSGGEAVMRPEWTAAVGPDFVNQMNAAARSGGVDGVRRAMQGGSYFLGGILPLPGARVVRQQGYSGYAADLNVGSGSDDYGMPVRAWKDGIIAAMRYIGDTSYGRWMDINHGKQSSRYAHLASFMPGLFPGMEIKGGQTLGFVGNIGNSSAPHLHFEVNGGAVPIGDSADGGGGPSIPGWLKDIVMNPLKSIKGWVTDKWSAVSDMVKESPAFDLVKRVPLEAAQGVKDKALGILPGWVKSIAGGVADAAGAVGDFVGDAASGAADAIGFANGGVLPYNGTMKYDAGGYLPPGLTTVVNLTGKPEPVFTADQFDGMQGGAGIHYEPHFEGSDLRPEDVAADLNFQFRRMRRGGKYEGVGS